MKSPDFNIINIPNHIIQILAQYRKIWAYKYSINYIIVLTSKLTKDGLMRLSGCC